MPKKAKRFWRIEGYDSTTLIYEGRRPLGNYSEERMEQLLRTLTAKAGLEMEDIIDSFSKRNAKGHLPLLEVQRSGPPFTLMCGDNPYFIATVVESDRSGS